MADKRLVQYDFTPALAPGDGGQSANGRVKQSELLANFDDISYGIFKFRYKGADLIDRGSNAASCNIWLVTDSGAKLGVTVGEKVYVRFSNDYLWETTVLEDGGDPYIVFGDLEAMAPAVIAIADYSSAVFISSLTVLVTPVKELISTTNLVFAGDGAITGSNIDRSSTDTEKISAKLLTLETQADSVIETAGGLSDEVVTADSLIKNGTGAIHADDHPGNICLDGSVGHFIYEEGVAYGFEKTATPATSYSKETTTIKEGLYSQKFVTSAGGVGLKVLFDPREGGITTPGSAQVVGKDIAGNYVTITTWYRADEADNVEIGFWDDVDGYTVTAQTVAADSWTKLSGTVQISGLATNVVGIIRSAAATATSHYVSNVAMNFGETEFDITMSTSSSIVDNMLTNKFNNMIPFGDLSCEKASGAPAGDGNYFGHAWLAGDDVAPLGWTSDGTTLRSEVTFKFGNASWGLDLAAGETAETYIGISSSLGYPLIQECQGKWCTFSTFFFRGLDNTTDITMRVTTDGTGGGATDYDYAVNDYDAWAQIAVSVYVPSDATEIKCEFRNDSGSTISFFLDGLMFNQSPYPISFVSTSGWSINEYTFSKTGALDGTIISPSFFNHQELDVGIPIGMNQAIIGTSLVVGTVAGVGTSSLVYPIIYEWDNAGGDWDTGTVVSSVQSTISTGEAYVSNGAGTDPGLLSAGSLLRCASEVTAGLTEAEDGIVTIHCLVWGP